jgi:Uncharacterised protein family (UPF0259)
MDPVSAPQPTPSAPATPPVVSAPQPANPTATWPGAFGIFNPSRMAVALNIWTILGLFMVNIVPSIITNLLTTIFGEKVTTQVGETAVSSVQVTGIPGAIVGVVGVIGIVLSVIMTCAFIATYLASVRQQKISIAEAFAVGRKFAWRSFLLGLLVGLVVFGGLLLLIVPGIIFAMRLSLAEYYLVDKNMGVMEAYKASWHATKGHMGKLWGFVGVGLLAMLLVLIPVAGWIAIAVLAVMYSAAMAFFYEYIQAHPATAK